MSVRHVLLVCLIAVLLPQSALGSDAELDQRRMELDELQQKIQAVDHLVARFEAERQLEATELVKAERAVSVASRQLQEVEARLEKVKALISEHERGAAALALRIEEQLEELAHWLRRHYMLGGNDSAPVLAGRDPNQLARDIRYLEFLSEARAELISSLRQDRAVQSALLAAASEERRRLDALQSDKLVQQQKLEQTRRIRTQAVERLAASAREHRQQADLMRQSEAQLAEVVQALSLAAEARERAKQLSIQRARADTERRADSQSAPKAPTVRTIVSGKPFATLRGKLELPVSGELIGRFGTRRASTGTLWRGSFVRAAEGSQVVAIASGEVVFSDWLRGYGNLIIVDHGHDYLTIYGNNDALLSQVGEQVEAGKAIAMVGSAGWIQDSGLYFEIRHKGEPLDPMQWIKR